MGRRKKSRRGWGKGGENSLATPGGKKKKLEKSKRGNGKNQKGAGESSGVGFSESREKSRAEVPKKGGGETENSKNSGVKKGTGTKTLCRKEGSTENSW